MTKVPVDPTWYISVMMPSSEARQVNDMTAHMRDEKLISPDASLFPARGSTSTRNVIFSRAQLWPERC